MSEEWKNLDAKQKKKYDDKATLEKERYQRELEESGCSKNKKKKDNVTGDLKRP